MQLVSFKHLVIGLMMFAAAGMALALKPTQKVANSGAGIDLETLIPLEFGSWRLDPNQPVALINPVQLENINRIYDQTLTRTYIGPSNYRVMLSIAYGADQRSGVALAVHYPEVCYPAQGFEVEKSTVGSVATDHGAIPVRRLKTQLGSIRHEPVTYWTTIGSHVTLGGLDRRLLELEYGLRREIPDGLLFRVSSIDVDSDKAYRAQERFIQDLIKSLSPEGRVRMAGAGRQ